MSELSDLESQLKEIGERTFPPEDESVLVASIAVAAKRRRTEWREERGPFAGPDGIAMWPSLEFQWCGRRLPVARYLLVFVIGFVIFAIGFVLARSSLEPWVRATLVMNARISRQIVALIVFIPVALITFPAAYILDPVRSAIRRTERGHCQQCGYNCADIGFRSPGACGPLHIGPKQCPECGLDWPLILPSVPMET